ASPDPLSTEVPYPRRSCETFLFARPGGAVQRVSALGSWDGWALPGAPLEPHPTRAGWYVLGLTLPPGEYGYLLQEDGASLLDPANPLTTFRGSDEVSLLQVEDCAQAGLRIEESRGGQGGEVRLVGRYTASAAGKGLKQVTARVGEQALRVEALEPATGRFVVAGGPFPRGRHVVEIQASDGEGHDASVRPGVWVDPLAARWDEGLVYQVVVDRFRGDGGVALGPPPSPGARAGGTLDGLRAEIERGTFEPLGVTAFWLSPAYLNPEGAFPGRDGRMYEGYHGYWPLDSRGVDPKIGGEQALRGVIDAAHRRGMKVLLDVVPNHMFEKNPRFLERQGQGWFNELGACVCGLDGCDWGKFIQTCWFTPYLPDVRWQNEEAARQQIEDVKWWVDTFGLDGVRVDAVPMMPRSATRRIARALRDAAPADDPPFLLGEVFTGPGQGGIDQIRFFLGPDGLDSAFDFPLMWALRDAVAADRAGFDEVEKILQATDLALDGSGAVKARIIGNHDVTRFLSAAAGDDGGDPWLAPPPRPSDPVIFARHRLALALMLTLPGMPVLYYGDELGLPGASDPDCRRVLPPYEGLPAEEAENLALVRRLGPLRSCSAALRRGAHAPLLTTRDAYAFRRDADGETAVVLVAKGTAPTSFPLPPGTFRDLLAPGQPEVSGSLEVQPFTVRVLLSASSPCAAP
nr:alpha-amylase family glycosyl hydrolase [Polyangiaceae bacterium]